jgi:hypothetical protein
MARSTPHRVRGNFWFRQAPALRSEKATRRVVRGLPAEGSGPRHRRQRVRSSAADSEAGRPQRIVAQTRWTSPSSKVAISFLVSTDVSSSRVHWALLLSQDPAHGGGASGASRCRGRHQRQGDADPLSATHQLTDARPTRGCRWTTALLNRACRASGAELITRKRIILLTARSQLLLQRPVDH